jgi:hypothetical protein
MSDSLREAIFRRQIAEGSFQFTCIHPEFSPYDLPLLTSEIERQGLDLGEEAGWETAYASIKNRRLAVQKGESNGNN